MKTEYPSITAHFLGSLLFVVPLLWYFEGALWAWIVAGVFLAAVVCIWFSEALQIHRDQQAGQGGESTRDVLSTVVVEAEKDDFLAPGKTLWTGQRGIRFTYSDFSGDGSDREVTVHRVVATGRANGDTHFQGYCHLRNGPRTFRLDRIKGRKVIDSSTGEVGTFRQLFGLSSR